MALEKLDLSERGLAEADLKNLEKKHSELSTAYYRQIRKHNGKLSPELEARYKAELGSLEAAIKEVKDFLNPVDHSQQIKDGQLELDQKFSAFTDKMDNDLMMDAAQQERLSRWQSLSETSHTPQMEKGFDL